MVAKSSEKNICPNWQVANGLVVSGLQNLIMEATLQEHFGRQSDLRVAVVPHAIEARDTLKALLNVDKDDAAMCQIHAA